MQRYAPSRAAARDQRRTPRAPRSVAGAHFLTCLDHDPLGRIARSSTGASTTRWRGPNSSSCGGCASTSTRRRRSCSCPTMRGTCLKRVRSHLGNNFCWSGRGAKFDSQEGGGGLRAIAAPGLSKVMRDVVQVAWIFLNDWSVRAGLETSVTLCLTARRCASPFTAAALSAKPQPPAADVRAAPPARAGGGRARVWHALHHRRAGPAGRRTAMTTPAHRRIPPAAQPLTLLCVHFAETYTEYRHTGGSTLTSRTVLYMVWRGPRSPRR